MKATEWKYLRAHAASPSDFQKLAGYCQRREAQALKSEAVAQKDLAAYYSRDAVTPVPKYPARDQTLKALAARYAADAKHWGTLAAEYLRRAR